MNASVLLFVMEVTMRKILRTFLDWWLFSCFWYSNIAEQLIEKGLASVVRHKRDDEDRSPDYDKLMTAEQL